MAEPHPFRRAAEAKDLELMAETLADDVTLHSPVLFNGFEGREAAIALLTHVAATLEDLTYLDEVRGGDSVVLRFRANVGELQLEGIDYLTLDADGRVADLTVFMRPQRAVIAFRDQMTARLGGTLPA